MLLSTAIEQFLAAHRHRWSGNTLVWYRARATTLLNYLGDIDVETITAQNLRDWMYWQVAEMEYSDSTKAGNWLAVSTMFEMLTAKGIVSENHFDNPGNNLDRPKIREQIRPKAKHEVVFKFLDFIEREAVGYLERKAHTAYLCAKRDIAMLWLMISTGCRRIEVQRLSKNDVQIEHLDGKRMGVIRFIGKNFKQRRNYIAGKPLAAIEVWLELRPEPASDDTLFLSSRPRNGLYYAVSNTFLNDRLEYWAKKGGFENETLNPHSFRRAYATYAVANGTPVTVVQRQLGHEDISTTMRYIKHDEAALRTASSRILDVLENDWESRGGEEHK